MAGGNVGARIIALVLLAVVLNAARQPGGIASWARAKLVNAPR
jgi:hypothetical protein